MQKDTGQSARRAGSMAPAHQCLPGHPAVSGTPGGLRSRTGRDAHKTATINPTGTLGGWRRRGLAARLGYLPRKPCEAARAFFHRSEAMSRQIRLTISDAYVAGLEEIAIEDGQTTGTKVDISPVIRTAIRKYLNRRGLPNDKIDRQDEK